MKLSPITLTSLFRNTILNLWYHLMSAIRCLALSASDRASWEWRMLGSCSVQLCT